MKVFGVGFIKTGTVSLGAALKILGFNHCDGSFTTGNILLQSYLSGNYQDIFNLVEKYDSFDDLPFCAPGVAEVLNTKYADSKFILTIRDSESWFSSISRYLPSDVLNFRARDGLPLGPFYGLVNYILSIFGTTKIEDNKDHFKKIYEEYNQRVIDFFKDKPGKLLVVSWMEGDGWAELCNFLKSPLPASSLKFPHRNRNEKS